jgi:hypothetical protein
MCVRRTMDVGRGIYVVEMFEWDEHLQRELDLGGARLTVAGRQGDTTASVRQEQVS